MRMASLSARRAWIEMVTGPTAQHCRVWVALRKESVDRNSFATGLSTKSIVALRKESVDRNALYLLWLAALVRSLSARRAWIEMGKSRTQSDPVKVALRKESVDRNRGYSQF